jgi:hypothetical protein
MSQDADGLLIGWATTDLTPNEPVLVTGQFYARVSEGVLDPITATVLVLDSGDKDSNCIVMVSCDLVTIPNSLRDAVRGCLLRVLPDFNPHKVFLNATHTHAGPEVRLPGDALLFGGGNVPSNVGIELEVMEPADYVAFAAERIAGAIVRAWNERQPGGIGFGLGHAVVGHNRRISYYNGETRMYGKTDDPEFSHIEGYEDHSLNVLCTWDLKRNLTGVVVNIACPSQTDEHSFLLSADYWHETREELRRRLGEDIFILPQNSASGELVPHVQLGRRAEERMWQLAGRTQRQDIAVRIADEVARLLPIMEQDVKWNPPLMHRVETVELSRRNLAPSDVEDALRKAAELRAEYENLLRDLEANPEQRHKPRWYVPVTAAFRRMKWNEGVANRFEHQQVQPKVSVELHVVRLGDVVFATNPFEYFVDFGMQIKGRSKAVQTFLVQHVGPGSYLPTERAVAGRSYGAVPASTPVGPEGGRELARWTVDAINDLYQGEPG